ncbi:MAG TPA: ATP-binding cassette domain-containing protein [Mycobacteriales bacterium]|nr:ATP-binding cassette domain-containing protein [Mycobacteriales bacterium]
MTTGLEVVLRDVTHTYTTDEVVVALDRADLTVAPGGSVALVGPSGSGKSTVLTLLAGLQRPDEGEVRIGDHVVSSLPQRRLHALRAETVAAVLQVPGAGLLPWASARENLDLVRRAARATREGRSPEELLARLGLEQVADAPVARLSGGEQQRVALATALVHRPSVLLLDEPTSQLDARSRGAALALLREVHDEEHATIVIATHDREVAGITDDVVWVQDGRLL